MLLHPSVMIKKEFLLNHHIEYQNYPCVEDYKLWFDIAKAGGILFVEPQELLMFRRSDTQVTVTKKKGNVFRFYPFEKGNSSLSSLCI